MLEKQITVELQARSNGLTPDMDAPHAHQPHMPRISSLSVLLNGGSNSDSQPRLSSQPQSAVQDSEETDPLQVVVTSHGNKEKVDCRLFQPL